MSHTLGVGYDIFGLPAVLSQTPAGRPLGPLPDGPGRIP
jgi:hypothetical protein